MQLEIPFELVKGAEPIILSPMHSKEEKTILEYMVMQDDLNLVFNTICKLLGIPDYIPYELKLACIYKVREISFGSDMQLRYQCKKCGSITESKIMLENLLQWPIISKELNIDLKETDLKKIFKYAPSSAFKFFGVHQPNTLAEASKYALLLRAKIPTIKKTIPSRCFLCGDTKAVNIVNKKFVIDSLSEQNMLGMIKVYNALALNGFSKMDVDSMLPFEREVHAQLFKDRAESYLPNKEK